MSTAAGKRIVLITFVFMALFCLYAIFDAEEVSADTTTRSGVIKNGPLNLRTGPGTDYSAAGTIAKGKKVTIMATTKRNGTSWYKITYKSKTRYVAAKYVKAGKTTTVTYSKSKTAVVKNGPLNVRSGPSTSKKRLGSLAKGKKVTVKALCKVSGSYSWYRITYKSKTAYVCSSYMKIKTTASSSGSSTEPVTYTGTNAQKVIACADSKLGCAYQLGASGPDKFDCSGFVYWVMKNCGAQTYITAPSTGLWKTTYDSKYAAYSIGTDYTKALPGDIVVFSTNGRMSGITHVAFYYGNGKIIHASSSSTGVCVSSITASAAGKPILGIVRIIK